MLKILFLILSLNFFVAKTDNLKFDTDFIKHFIQNEQKPTILAFHLCWGKDKEILLSKELSNIGIRSTTSWKQPKMTDNKNNLLYAVDLNCHDGEELILQATSNNLIRSPYRWLVISNSSHEGTVLEVLPLLPDSDLVLAVRSAESFIMTELYKPSPNASIISTTRGIYNGTFYDVRPHRSLFKRRWNVMGHPLTMANVIQDSNSTQYHLPREDRLELEYDAVAKISWSNVKLAFLMLNATPKYIFSHRWGYQVNGSWSGMIDDIYSNRADVGTNCLLKAERFPVVVFTDNLVPFKVRFVFRQPPLSYVSNIFSLPFSSGVWIAMTVCAASATLALYVATYWEATVEKSPTQLDGSLGDALLLTMSAVSQQGCVLEPNRASGRIMVWFLFLALMALYAAYSANIVVLLQAPSNAVRSLSQLAYSKITLAAHDVDYNYFIFKLNRYDAVRNEIYKKVDPEKGKKQFYDMNDGVARIRQGLFAFHSIAESVYRQIENTFLESEKCDLMEVDFLNDYDPFTPVKKDSPYLELLRVAFKYLRESGIRDTLYKRLLTPKPKCTTKGAAFSSVGLMDLKPVLFLMLYGIAVSLAILFIEILVHKVSEHRKTIKRTQDASANFKPRILF